MGSCIKSYFVKSWLANEITTSEKENVPFHISLEKLKVLNILFSGKGCIFDGEKNHFLKQL